MACFDDELWVGTHEGLFVVNERKNKIVHLKQDLMRSFSLSDKIIYTIYQDREGEFGWEPCLAGWIICLIMTCYLINMYLEVMGVR